VTLDRFGYLLREQIQALYFESVPRCNARLRLLFDWQFVAKIETPLLLERGTASGCQAIYTCGKASYPLLAEHWSCEERVVRARHRAPTPSSLLHTLEEVNFYLQVQRAVQTVPSVALEGYFGEWESLHDYEVRVPGSAGNGWQRAVFKPDALLVLGPYLVP